MNRRKNAQSGFTFIEIIVAVSILSIIILTLYSLMDVGFSFWDYIDKSRWSYTDIQMVINEMGKDFRCTFYPTNSPRYPFKGNMYQVEFFTQELTSGEVSKLVYEYSPYDKTLFLHKGEDKIALLTDVEKCNFFFYHPDYGYWDNYWDSLDKKKIPSAVRLDFFFKDSEEEYKFDMPIYIGEKGISAP